jgi:hypothetical protein
MRSLRKLASLLSERHDGRHGRYRRHQRNTRCPRCPAATSTAGRDCGWNREPSESGPLDQPDRTTREPIRDGGQPLGRAPRSVAAL